MEFIKDYWGVIALGLGSVWGLITNHFTTMQNKNDVAGVKNELKDFKTFVYGKIEVIEERQIAATDKLSDVLQDLNINLTRLDESNKHLSRQVDKLEKKLP